jgi:tetratricopeptide (TPR) repeat protein
MSNSFYKTMYGAAPSYRPVTNDRVLIYDGRKIRYRGIPMRFTGAMKTSIVLPLVAAVLASCAVGLWNARSEFDLGAELFNRGQYAEAIPHFQAASELDLKFAQAHLYLGRCYVTLGRYLEAIFPLRTAYSLSPQEVGKEALNILLDALLRVAISEVQKGNFEGALGHLKDALNLDPGSRQVKEEVSRTLTSFGGQLLMKGNLSGAIDRYTDALSYAPDNVGAYMGLARAFLQRGDVKKAIEAWQGASKIDPGNKDLPNLLRELMTK